jgi:hypothetical protein
MFVECDLKSPNNVVYVGFGDFVCWPPETLSPSSPMCRREFCLVSGHVGHVIADVRFGLLGP